MAATQPEVVLVRHGATEWSENGRHTGRTDVPLNETGRRQAREIGRLLQHGKFSLVLTSPLQRARETCRLAGLGDQAEVDDDLYEWDYGAYEGRTTAEIRKQVPGWTVWSHEMVDGESIEQVAARADRVIERVLTADGLVALFAHGHVLRVLTARWCELEPQEGRRFALETGTWCALGWEHEYRTVRGWNRRDALAP